MDDLPPNTGPLEMADLPYVSLFKRASGRKPFWQYRRHIPEAKRHRFKQKAEFFRTLTGDWSGKLTAEQVAEWQAVNAEFEAIADGTAARALAQSVLPRANNRDAPPLSREAQTINAALAKAPRHGWAEIEHDDPVTVAQAVQRFMNDPLRAATEKTKIAHAPRLDTLAALLAPDPDSDEPETYIAAVGKSELRRAVTMLNALPREHARKYTGMTPAQAIEQGAKHNAPTLSPKTIGHYIETWRSFFAWCEQEDLIPANPAKGLKAPAAKPSQDRRNAWQADALNALLGTGLHRDPAQRLARPGAFWVPLIALFQGLRESEAVLLRKDDLKAVDGVWCIHLRERDGRTLKNMSSVRVVPVHQALLDIGLKQYVDALPDGAMLWPDLVTGKRGQPLKDPPDMYGKREFPALVRAAKIAEPGHLFHALRHRFATACRAARMADSVRLYLGGWSQTEGVASTYGHHEDKAALKAELDRVSYPGVTLPPR